MESDWIRPDWPAPVGVQALLTTRNGGTSCGAFAGRAGDGGMNLRFDLGDDPEAVRANRQILQQCLPAAPVWMRQVHGIDCVDAALVARDGAEPPADAAYTRVAGVVCAVLTADCLPVLFCDTAGQVVAAAHAGWRGLAGGVLEAAVHAMAVAPEKLLVFLGPAIGPRAFEVGDEVRAAFLADAPAAAVAFVAHRPGKWLASLEQLARLRLQKLGITAIYGGGRCTVEEAEHFYSYRREAVTGRMAALIWLTPPEPSALAATQASPASSAAALASAHRL